MMTQAILYDFTVTNERRTYRADSAELPSIILLNFVSRIRECKSKYSL